jgi:hypothetical protein
LKVGSWIRRGGAVTRYSEEFEGDAVGLGESSGAADGASEEHGARAFAEAVEEVLELVGVVPAAQAQGGAQLVAGFSMHSELGVSACPPPQPPVGRRDSSANPGAFSTP